MIGAQLHCLDGGFHAGIRGQENDQDVLVELLDLAQNGHAVGVWQPIVEQDQVDPLWKLFQSGPAGIGLEHVIAFPLQALGKGPPNQRFIINDEDCGFDHGAIANPPVCWFQKLDGRSAGTPSSRPTGLEPDCASRHVRVGNRRPPGRSSAACAPRAAVELPSRIVGSRRGPRATS